MTASTVAQHYCYPILLVLSCSVVTTVQLPTLIKSRNKNELSYETEASLTVTLLNKVFYILVFCLSCFVISLCSYFSHLQHWRHLPG